MSTQLPQAVQRKVAKAVELTKSAAAQAAPAAPATAASATPPATPAAPSLEDRLKSVQQEKDRLERELAEAVQREKVTRGRYEAEVPRLQADVKAAKETLAELERKSKPVEAGKIRSLSDQDRAFAGEQMLELIAKVSREVAQDEAEARIKPFVQRIDLLERQTEAQFFSTLEVMCPSWEKQNDDPSFISWLNGTDPGTGRSRMDRLRTAEAQRQGYLVSEIFNAYREKREIGARAPTPPSNLNLTPPSDGASPNPPAAEEGGGRTFTRGEISQFYREKREGKWKGREDEARAIEKEIFAARDAGRVT